MTTRSKRSSKSTQRGKSAGTKSAAKKPAKAVASAGRFHGADGKPGKAAKATQSSRQKDRPTIRKKVRKGMEEEAAHNDGSLSSKPFPIVGIGASAGGLEAITQFLQALPNDINMAFVVVQHLDPTHESALTTLLARLTALTVLEATNDMPIEAGHLYVIPPNKVMEISDRRLKVFPRKSRERNPLPIDIFFQSLAREEGGNAIGVILSGNGSDGTQGLLAIKAAAGFTFAQDERTAGFSSMPASAIATGCVDFVLPPVRMASELKRVADRTQGFPQEEKGYDELLTLLRQRTDVDFRDYKQTTLRRRFLRRMVLHKMDSLQDYADFVRGHESEVNDLFNDVLIHVTSFFRDPKVFQALSEKLLPRLLKQKSPQDRLRIWVPGCSTGEEVYSLAMIVAEVTRKLRMNISVQIFGTDIHEWALHRARMGLYPASIQSEVSATRLRKFFLQSDGGYRVSKSIREMCVFARQNLAKDPPLSDMDMIACRNLLIYLKPRLQHKIIPIFHYALRHQGLLMLGASESIGGFADLFSLVDKKAKIYVTKATHTRPLLTFARATALTGNHDGEKTPSSSRGTASISDVKRQADRIVVENYGLPGVVINREMEVLQFRGRTGPYLEHAQGQASLNLLRMAPRGMILDLKAIVKKAIKQHVRVRTEDVHFEHNKQVLECAIEVIPFSAPPSSEVYYLVNFQPQRQVSPPKRKWSKSHSEDGESESGRRTEESELIRVREELAATRESLQTALQELEESSEEYRSANEEILSSNEELQSTNEELETTKEEMQATNEELTTLNDELESRNTELGRANDDLQNVFLCVDIPLLILDEDLKIRRFTNLAAKMFHLIPADINRSISRINLRLNIPDFERLVHGVFDSLKPEEVEVRDQEGHWWSLRIRPYRTTDHKIQGAVVALVNIDGIKLKSEQRARMAQFAEATVNTVREPLIILDKDLKVKFVNQAFYKTFKVSPDEITNRLIYDLGNGQWNIPSLRDLLEHILPTNSFFCDYAVEHRFPHIGKKRMILNARKLNLENDAEEMILLAIEPSPDP